MMKKQYNTTTRRYKKICAMATAAYKVHDVDTFYKLKTLENRTYEVLAGVKQDEYELIHKNIQDDFGKAIEWD